MKVVLPDPFGPIRPRTSPCRSVMSTPLTATRPPKRTISLAVSSTTFESSRRASIGLGQSPAFAEQALWPDDEHDEEEEEPVDVPQTCSEEDGSQALDEPEQDPGDRSAGHRPQPPDNDDFESLDRGDGAVCGEHEEYRRKEGPGQAGERDADRERDLIDAEDVQAGCLDAHAVLGACPKRKPAPGPREQVVEQADDDHGPDKRCDPGASYSQEPDHDWGKVNRGRPRVGPVQDGCQIPKKERESDRHDRPVFVATLHRCREHGSDECPVDEEADDEHHRGSAEDPHA